MDTQEELRQHLLSLGMSEQSIGTEEIPQGVLLISNRPLTQAEKGYPRKLGLGPPKIHYVDDPDYPKQTCCGRTVPADRIATNPYKVTCIPCRHYAEVDIQERWLMVPKAVRCYVYRTSGRGPKALWTAHCTDFDLWSAGSTETAAIENLEEVVHSYVAAVLDTEDEASIPTLLGRRAPWRFVALWHLIRWRQRFTKPTHRGAGKMEIGRK